MRFEHKLTVPASLATVQAFLSDFQKAAACVPDLRDLHEVEPDVYEGTVRVRIGPLGLNVGGRALLDRSDPTVWRVQGEGRDRRVGAGVTANVEARLSEQGPATTEVLLLADVQFSGRLAELGQPLIRRKADAFVAEFAENLRKAISAA